MTIIAFISQKGGVGKSTLSQALAVEAKKQKLSVLLADCDSQQATSQEWSKIRGKIPCQVFQQVKDVWPLSKQYELIIIDGPARTSMGTLEIAKKADLLIQPTGASRADLIPAVKEFHALKKAGITKQKLLFVLTRLATKSEEEAGKEYLKASGYNYSPICLYEKASYRQVQNEGKAISEVNYKSLGEIPREASANIQAPELAPNDGRITGRTKQLNLKVKEEIYWLLKEIALQEKKLMTEVLEKALDCYSKQRK